MTREEARDRILTAGGQVAQEGDGETLRKNMSALLSALLKLEWEAQAESIDPEVRAAAQDILRVLGIEAEVPES